MYKIHVMKKIILSAILLLNLIGYSKVTKKEIIDEIEGYKRTKLLNSTYNS